MSSQILKEVIKGLIWTVPALLLIGKNPGFVKISLKEMFTVKVRWLRYLWLFALFAVYILAGAYHRTGTLAISKDFSMDHVIILLFVGITEETVFRGWLLNTMISDKRKWPAVSVNALMFLVIHFPRWIVEGEFIASFIGFGFLSLIALSVAFSLVFVKSKNILVPICLHTFWDLLMFLFF